MSRLLTLSVVAVIGLRLAIAQDVILVTNMSFFSHNGVIRGASTGQPIASGFVVGTNKDVVTSWHRIESAKAYLNETNFLFVAGTNASMLAPKAYLTNYDLAVFYTQPGFPGMPLYPGDFNNVDVGDTVIYAGYDQRYPTTNKLTAATISSHLATVVAKTNKTVNGRKVAMFYFTGTAIPGFSGGAVYNANIEVIGLVHGMTTQGVSVAYSIEPLVNWNVISTSR